MWTVWKRYNKKMVGWREREGFCFLFQKYVCEWCPLELCWTQLTWLCTQRGLINGRCRYLHKWWSDTGDTKATGGHCSLNSQLLGSASWGGKSKDRKLQQPVATDKSTAEDLSWPLYAGQKASSSLLKLHKATDQRLPGPEELAAFGFLVQMKQLGPTLMGQGLAGIICKGGLTRSFCISGWLPGDADVEDGSHLE